MSALLCLLFLPALILISWRLLKLKARSLKEFFLPFSGDGVISMLRYLLELIVLRLVLSVELEGKIIVEFWWLWCWWDKRRISLACGRIRYERLNLQRTSCVGMHLWLSRHAGLGLIPRFVDPVDDGMSLIMRDLNSLHFRYLKMVPDIICLELLLLKRNKPALKVLMSIADPKNISSFVRLMIQQNLEFAS